MPLETPLDQAARIIGLLNLTAAVLVGGLAVPLIYGKVKMNRLYGVRFARSFESGEAWYAINRYGGKLLLLWSIPVALSGLLPWFVSGVIVLALVASAPCLYLVPCIQSWRYARRWNR